jgi:hypothetical protein
VNSDTTTLISLLLLRGKAKTTGRGQSEAARDAPGSALVEPRVLAQHEAELVALAVRQHDVRQLLHHRLKQRKSAVERRKARRREGKAMLRGCCGVAPAPLRS